MSQIMSAPTHTPVLLNETLEGLAVQPGGRYIDCTLGSGGHAAAILEQSSPGGQLLGIDADPKAIKAARENLKAYDNSMLLINQNFANLQAICYKHDFFPVHGILFDLGLSSLQLNGNGRGFSFQYEAPLDMRISPSQKTTAADIINTYPEIELARLIKTYGEEGHSHKIAHHIVAKRPVKTTVQLAQTIEQAIGSRRSRIHPATKTFQALRIAVNRELENLESALRQAVNLLGFKGRLVVISYHSLEDRRVKQLMKQEARDCICPPEAPTCTCGHKAKLKLVNKRVITPSVTEVQQNPRSRSAKLRVAERVIAQDDYYRATEKLSNSTELRTMGWRRAATLKKLKAVFTAA